jgi:ABC-2 type transport system ATP-binding protein
MITTTAPGGAEHRRRSTEPAASALMRLDGVSKRWGDRVVLDQIDLELHPGDIAAIVGANGAGKTTLLRIAAGIILPEAGRVELHGRDIEDDPAAHRQALGFLSAGDRGLVARLTVRQNLDFWGGLAGMPRPTRRRRTDAVLSDFEIVELADRRVDRLSMGQRQRVRLAMTFLHEPRLLLLDEPKASLDDVAVEVMRAALVRLAADGGTVLWASPAVEDPVINRSWVIEAGKIRPYDRPEQVAPREAPLTASGVRT